LSEAVKDPASLLPFQRVIGVEPLLEDPFDGDDVGANGVRNKILGEVGGAARHGQHAVEVRGWWWAAMNPRVRLEMKGTKEKIDGSDYHIGERCVV
jgi:hypothetical protein